MEALPLGFGWVIWITYLNYYIALIEGFTITIINYLNYGSTLGMGRVKQIIYLNYFRAKGGGFTINFIYLSYLVANRIGYIEIFYLNYITG